MAMTIPSQNTTRSNYLSSDLEEDRLVRQQEENTAEQALQAIKSLLDTADSALGDLEENDKLGTAITRGCKDLADAIGNLANELDQQSDEERRALANACLEDASDLLLQDESSSCRPGPVIEHSATPMDKLTQDEMMLALVDATSLLRDVEAAFRSIDQSEADEIADVALTLARLFLMSLQDLYSTLTPQDLVNLGKSQQESRGLSGGIELLDENDQAIVDTNNTPETRKNPRTNRVRVLWPPIGPAVNSACQWGKEEAAKKPLLAVALGLTLWPVAITATILTAPLVLADDFLQKTYASISDKPLVENLERGAAELYAAGRLCLLCGGLATRQTLRVASRQIERRGGAVQVAQDLGGMALDRAMHPVETFGMAWNGISLGVGAIRNAVGTVQGMAERDNGANFY
jgi:hypothetical protein